MAEALSAILSAEQEERIAALLGQICEAQWRLATAESCTGGLIASIFTDVPGCSHAFEAGFVTYSDKAKEQMLGVNANLLEDHGAVSEPVALAMVDGALDRSDAHLVISLTGFTGEADPGQEAGLVYVAGGLRNGLRIVSKHRFGDIGRGPARLCCVDAALDMAQLLFERRACDGLPPDEPTGATAECTSGANGGVKLRTMTC